MHRIDGRIDDEQLELLNAYLDGELPEDQRVAMAEHVHACRVCARELESLCAVRQALEALPLVRAPRSFTLEFEPAPAGPFEQFLGVLRDWLTPVWGISATVASILFIIALVQTLTMSPAAARRATGMTTPAPAAERAAPAGSSAERSALPAQPNAARSASEAAPTTPDRPAGQQQFAAPQAQPAQPDAAAPVRQATPAGASPPGPARGRGLPVGTMPIAFYGAVVFTAIAVGGYLLQKVIGR